MALTLRTDNNFEEQLNRLKNRLDIKTGTGLIKHIVGTYGHMSDELAETKRELARVGGQLEILLSLHRRKCAAEEALSDFFANIE